MTDLDALERLARLHAEGALDDAEFQAEKRKLLAAAPATRRPLLWAAGLGGLLVVGASAWFATSLTDRMPAGNGAATRAGPPPKAAGAMPPAPADPAPAPPQPVVDLSPHIGRYPTDRVHGVSFRAEPAVQAAVRRAVRDAALSRLILSPAVEVPIEADGDRMVSGACEAHLCDLHNWTILIDRRGTNARVCHFDGRRAAAATWYRGDGTSGTGQGPCPMTLQELRSAGR